MKSRLEPKQARRLLGTAAMLLSAAFVVVAIVLWPDLSSARGADEELRGVEAILEESERAAALEAAVSESVHPRLEALRQLVERAMPLHEDERVRWELIDGFARNAGVRVVSTSMGESVRPSDAQSRVTTTNVELVVEGSASGILYLIDQIQLGPRLFLIDQMEIERQGDDLAQLKLEARLCSLGRGK